MVPRWKRLQIRAFILVRSDNPNPDLLQRQRELVVKMLELLRIRAEAVALQWTPEGPRATMSDETSTGGVINGLFTLCFQIELFLFYRDGLKGGPQAP